MLPEDAYIRNLPRALELKLRLAYEALLNASDAITIAYGRLVENLKKVEVVGGFQITDIERTTIGMDCWTIVDSVHAIFQVVNRFPMGQLSSPDLKKYRETSSRMRNGMDHIHANIDNLSKKKGGQSPLYGNIMFATPIKNDLTYDILSLSIGAMRFNEEIGSVFGTQIIKYYDDIGNISFSAFGVQLEFTEILYVLKDAIVQHDAELRHVATKSLREHAKINGLDPIALASNTVRGTVIIKFSCRLELPPLDTERDIQVTPLPH